MVHTNLDDLSLSIAEPELKLEVQLSLLWKFLPFPQGNTWGGQTLNTLMGTPKNPSWHFHGSTKGFNFHNNMMSTSRHVWAGVTCFLCQYGSLTVLWPYLTLVPQPLLSYTSLFPPKPCHICTYFFSPSSSPFNLLVSSLPSTSHLLPLPSSPLHLLPFLRPHLFIPKYDD